MLLQTCVLMKVYVVKVDSFGIHKYMMPRLVFGGVWPSIEYASQEVEIV